MMLQRECVSLGGAGLEWPAAAQTTDCESSGRHASFESASLFENSFYRGVPESLCTGFQDHVFSPSTPDFSAELDPHVCKEWPCPRCNKPRATQNPSKPYRAASVLPVRPLPQLLKRWTYFLKRSA